MLPVFIRVSKKLITELFWRKHCENNICNASEPTTIESIASVVPHFIPSNNQEQGSG
jgi:hypothetical protein